MRPLLRIPRRDLVFVLVVTAVAAVPRLWRLDAVGFRGDEAVYAGQAAVLAGIDGMDQFVLASRGSSNFLIFQGFLSAVYGVFGVSDLAARVVSAVFSILTVGFVYAIGRLLYGRSAGLFAALALALSSYAVVLGRLALLDSTFTFFGTVAVACLLMFYRTDRAVWMYGFAAAVALSMQTKVVGVLLLPVAALFALAQGTRPRLTLRRVVTAAAVGAVFLTPAWVQLATISHITDFLSSSTRSSGVPWYYYYAQLLSHEGLAMTAMYGVGLLWAAVRRSRSDLVPVLWLGVILLFLQAYPLKGFNYLLPVIPALALLAGRAAGEAWEWLAGWWAAHQGTLRRAAMGLGAGSIAGVLVVGSAPSVVAAVGEDSSAGLREAARWLARNGAAGDGVMTISHGSAQYVLSFYGGLDAYPFGRFQLATVLPGGKIVLARAGSAPDGGPPRDWVNYWPPRLINQGTVSYLVYYTGHLDDPPTQHQLTGTMTRRQFRGLIARYGGELVHKVYWNHEPRVYIYRVTKRLPYPVVDMRVAGDQITVTGQGFVARSPVTVTSLGRTVARGRADPWGEVELTMPLFRDRLSYHLVVTDAAGNDASATGLPDTEVDYTLTDGRVQVQGSGYAPGAAVTVSYAGQQLGRAVAGERGRFTFAFRLPAEPKPGGRIEASDEHGQTASVAGPPASVAGPPASVAGPPASVRDRYLVRRGDSLWSIADAEYGSGRQWRLIWRHNMDRVPGGTLADPQVIQPGLELELPPAAGRAATVGPVAPGAGR